MMQLLVPIFPDKTSHLTPTLGVFEKDNIVNYLHCGVPIRHHPSDDLNYFRYTIAHLVDQGLCRQSDIVRVFHVSCDLVYRSVKKLREQGDQGFFGTEQRQGHSHKMIAEKITKAQSSLDSGMSQSATARKLGVSEGTIRYALNQGRLKKSP